MLDLEGHPNSKQARKRKKKGDNQQETFPQLEFSNEIGNKPVYQAKSRILLDFDTVGEYVKCLRENYDEFGYFFFDPHGGRDVTVVWKTASFKTAILDVEVDIVAGRMMENIGQIRIGGRRSEMKLCPNLPAILEDFSLLGRGLVKNVELRTEKWKI